MSLLLVSYTCQGNPPKHCRYLLRQMLNAAHPPVDNNYSDNDQQKFFDVANPDLFHSRRKTFSFYHKFVHL